MFEKRFLTLSLAPAYGRRAGHCRQGITLTFPVVFVGNEPRHRQSFICSTGEAGSDSSDSSTSDSAPASIAEQLGSAAGAECPTASRRLQTCKSACGQSASTVSKATSSTISSEASEKRNRTASQQHTLIRYRDECSVHVLFFVLCSWRQSVPSFRCLVVMHRIKKRRDFLFS